MTGLAVLPLTTRDQDRAARLARELDLPLLDCSVELGRMQDVQAVLSVSGESLRLQETGPRPPGPVEVDFGSGNMRHRRRAGNNELIGRAAGVGKKNPLRVMDGTAGLGRDAFVLADLGCEVVLCERNPVIAQLLLAGMSRARGSEDPWLRGVLSHMRLCQGDVRDFPDEVAAADVLYLDPMFPARDKSASVKKEMAIFQLLLGDVSDPSEADALLRWACSKNFARIVVKRPLRAVALAAVQPSHCIRGKAVRYDVYVRQALR